MSEVRQMKLTDEQVRQFQRQGFLSLGRMTTDAELVWLRDVYDLIVKRTAGRTPAELRKVIGSSGPISLVTIVSPEGIVPALKDTLFLRIARRMIARLLAVDEPCLLSGWRIFCKLAHGEETPWHQDAAYRPPPYHGASVWLPLDSATSESGCLSYLGGSHLGDVQPHHFHRDHLAVDSVDTSQAVMCPLAAGEATVHHCRTLHYAGPNITDQPRRALVVVCQVRGDC
jgi:hypothetical protein